VLLSDGQVYGTFLNALPGTIKHRMMAKVKKEHMKCTSEESLDTVLSIQPHGVFLMENGYVRQFLNDQKYCSIVESPYSYKPLMMSIALPKDSEFSDQFRFFILKAIENGLIEKWLKEAYPEAIGDVYKNRCSIDKTVNFGYGKLITPFTAICTGTAISIIIAFCERLYDICRKNQ
jgi:hypothetical protein